LEILIQAIKSKIKLMKSIPWILRIVIFILFMLSGIAKLYPAIWPFEKQLVDLGIANWCLAPYLARAIIGLELAIGIGILFNHGLKKIIIPLTILLLLAFCFHLGYQMFIYGPNNGNCGCFGQLIPMTPLEAFIKNIITIVLLVILYQKVNISDEENNSFKWPLITFLAAELLMFAGFPFAPCKPIKQALTAINNNVTQQIIDSNITAVTSALPLLDSASNKVSPIKEKSIVIKDTSNKINANSTKLSPNKSANSSQDIKPSSLVKEVGPIAVVSKFAAYDNFNGKAIGVDNGKKIICMFAPGCDHCQATAKTICGLRNKDFPEVAIIFMDEEVEKIPEFFKEAGCTFPYQVVDVPTFWTLLGQGTTPGVFCLHNGNITKMWEGIDKNKFEATGLKTAF
jgi:thiol-disulfide isomerase/thioredoxin/uncharacterized membrane protein YphA (DoxX/SURF4 family)